MARTSYLMRREGRYYVQARLARHVARIAGRELYRASLRTADYRQARQRLVECMTWVHRMNDTNDYVSLFEKNALQVRQYLADTWPISEERLVARRNYEELLKNMVRRARAVGCDTTMIEPDFQSLLNYLVRQNVDAEEWLRKIDNHRHYERGRADVEAKLGFAAAPASFRSSAPQMPFAVEHSSPEHSSANMSVQAHLRPPEPPWASNDANVENPPALFEGVVPEELFDAEPFVPPSPAPERSASAPAAATTSPVRMSEALSAYLAYDVAQRGNADARSIASLVVQFIIDMMDDPYLHDFDAAMASRIDEMMPDIPDRSKIPREHCVSLAARYRYALEHGWDELKRLTEARLQNNYHGALSRFFAWAIEASHYPHAKPVFSKTSPENLVSIQRDAFNPSEVRLILSQPLFTGCKSADWIWVPGHCFLQDHIYWGYVLSFLTGLRAGELGQIELDDIEEVDGIYYLQLRGFNPSKGRVARKDVKRFKTQASHRTIPLHPLLLDLGLLERVSELRAIACPMLFPEWEPYLKPGGEMRWGQPLTKSFQYLKRKVKLDRFDVTLYSSRHWFADLVDNTDIKHVTRTRIMGHSSRSDMPARYGSKQRLTTRDLKQIVGATSPVIDEMTELLMGAKHRAERGEMTVLKPWLLPHNWSEHYKEKLLAPDRRK